MFVAAKSISDEKKRQRRACMNRSEYSGPHRAHMGGCIREGTLS
jgi:hypothetical protein